MTIPQFANKHDLFKFLVDNETKIFAHKRAATKLADSISVSMFHVQNDGSIIEAEKSYNICKEELQAKKPIRVKCIVNTTNVLDSHGDVHINKLWNKSVKETKFLSLIKEHKFTFDDTISDDVKAYVQTFTWQDLGYKMDGETQALVFEAVIQPNDPTGMYERYVKGVVKNHSVGMQYIRLVTCVNSDDEYFEKEKSNWDKYYPMIANKEAVDEQGWFHAVLEARIIEGSAVKRGSNIFTPTFSVEPDIEATPAKEAPKSIPPASDDSFKEWLSNNKLLSTTNNN
jgi:hypothetical protein